jgi:tellurite resistance protein TehA-like permease
MLVVLAIWRHGYERFPLSYDPLYWGAVFPLGMYAVCTYRMAQAMDLSFLYPVSGVFVYVALSAWAVTFAGLVSRLGHRVMAVVRDPPPADPILSRNRS